MKRFFVLVSLLGQVCLAQKKTEVSIIPQPVSVKGGNGNFTLTGKTFLIARDNLDAKTASFFNDYLQQVYGFKLPVDKKEHSNAICLSTKKFIKAPDKDAYSLTVTKNGIVIQGDTYTGTFYGIQTLIQLLPVNTSKIKIQSSKLSIPFVTVQDYPRFSYRGMHLDVCRHFFPVSFIKKYIDYIALHKMNYFHWHLTDDQGWRIEIKKYPRLTLVGGWRNGTIIGRYPGTGNDNLKYGGFYTQDEVKEVVQYAADRHITVIPEIEMPGHSSAAIAAYPWLSCFPSEQTIIPSHPSEESKSLQARGVTKLVQETWGVFNDIFCAGKDSTFDFLQNVLDEVLPLFPSKYVHVGGDEAPKVNWKRCPNCQARIKQLNLKDEHELQSYFIQRMEKYVNSKGKTLIGWDEILEGGLAPNAVVMSWRGEQGGIDAASQNHDVIMTPQKPVYFDHSQTKNEDSLVIGGYNPIEQVYSYEPIPAKLDSTKAKYILGAQANLWTEYIAYPSKVEYMIFPRMSALSEVLWSGKEKKSWTDFEKRLQTQFKRYDLWKTNYSKAYFDLTTEIKPSKDFNGIMFLVKSKDSLNNVFISYKTDVLTPDLKNKMSSGKGAINLQITQSGNYLIYQLKNGKPFGQREQSFSFNKATGKKVSITKTPNEKYPGQGGAFSLVNGVYSNKGLSYPDWLGWIGDDMEATIDLGKATSFDSVRVHTIDQNGSWVYLPQYVEVQVSNDGTNFTSINKSNQFVKDTLTMGWITVSTPKQNARYLKIIAKNYGLIPLDKPGGGNKAWFFADEIQVY
ncbi:MAG: beta-N-acetylhexosaminidase [Chitinophagaceae bacterium]